MTAAALALGGLSASLFIGGAAGDAGGQPASRVVISTAEDATFGTILVSGTTVYALKPSATACAAACLKIWPQVLLPKGVKKARAGAGVSARKLGTVRRAHGARQVTYGGKALYWYTGDTAPGQVNGNINDTWGTWSVVTPAPAKAAPAPGSGVTSTSSAGTGGVSF